MNRLTNRRIYIVIAVIFVCSTLAFAGRFFFYSRQVAARIAPADIEHGTPVFYNDSTRGAGTWLWEFGNGDTSVDRSGEYTYPAIGRYQVRLTVNGKQEKRFIITIRSSQNKENEVPIRIIAPSSGLHGEYILFRGEGSSKEWRWDFGENGIIDAFEKTSIYRYNAPGRYEVKLITEETQYPVRHFINIEARYADDDTFTEENIMSNDIKEKLQAIVDQKPFNPNYNYILNKYLCGNPNILVAINNRKKNDFYSYCQGLKLAGKNKVRIESVLFDMDEKGRNCIVKLIVIQSNIE